MNSILLGGLTNDTLKTNNSEKDRAIVRAFFQVYVTYYRCIYTN